MLTSLKRSYYITFNLRRDFSTDICFLHLSNYILFQMDKGSFVGEKAFDTVDHDILLMKLESLGLSSDAIRWFRLYVSGRQQLVDVPGTFSFQANVSCGVPQRSVLGPLLFLIYVNDMSAVMKHKLFLYADDAAILVSGSNIEQV